MKQLNEIQLLQKRIDELKRERQKTHDLFVMAAICDDDSDAEEFLELSLLMREDIKNLKSELKRKLAQVADVSISSYNGTMSVGP